MKIVLHSNLTPKVFEYFNCILEYMTLFLPCKTLEWTLSTLVIWNFKIMLDNYINLCLILVGIAIWSFMLLSSNKVCYNISLEISVSLSLEFFLVRCCEYFFSFPTSSLLNSFSFLLSFGRTTLTSNVSCEFL